MQTTKMVTVFECQEYTTEMLEWLATCGSEVSIESPKSTTIDIHTHSRIYQTIGKPSPLKVTCHNEKMATMFKLKYSEILITATTILLTKELL